MVNCESGKKFVPGQVFGSKTGPRFVPGKILMSPSGVSTFIPGQVVYSSDRGSVFVPGNIVDTSSGPFFVPGRVVDLPTGGIKFVPGEIIETESGPRYVTEHETDLDLLDETEDQKEIVVQGFPVTPEELRLITAYPFAALHYPLKDGDGPIINSRMLRQMAAAGVAVNKLTNSNTNANNPNGNNGANVTSLNDVKVVATKDIDESILGADVFRTTEPAPKPPPAKKAANKEKTDGKSNKSNHQTNEDADQKRKNDNNNQKNNQKNNQNNIDHNKDVGNNPVQPVGVASESDGHVGKDVGKEKGGIPVGADGGGAKGLAAETGATEPANSQHASNEIVGNDAKTKLSPTQSVVDTVPLTKMSGNQHSEKDASTSNQTNETSTLAKSGEGGDGGGGGLAGTNNSNQKNSQNGTGASSLISSSEQTLNDTNRSVVDNSNKASSQTGSGIADGTGNGTSTSAIDSNASSAHSKNALHTANDNQNSSDANKTASDRSGKPVDQHPNHPSPTSANSVRDQDGGLLSSKNKVGQNNGDDSTFGRSNNGNTTGTATDANNATRLNQQQTKDGTVNSNASDQSNSSGTDGNAGKDGSVGTRSELTANNSKDSTTLQSLSANKMNRDGLDGADGSQDRERDDNSVDRQVMDIFERIKRDLDSVERDPFIRQTLADAEALALASGRPDLANKVRQLMDILKNTERDPEVVDLIKQILRMNKQNQSKCLANEEGNQSTHQNIANSNSSAVSNGASASSSQLSMNQNVNSKSETQLANGQQKSRGSSANSESSDSNQQLTNAEDNNKLGGNDKKTLNTSSAQSNNSAESPKDQSVSSQKLVNGDVDQQLGQNGQQKEQLLQNQSTPNEALKTSTNLKSKKKGHHLTNGQNGEGRVDSTDDKCLTSSAVKGIETDGSSVNGSDISSATFNAAGSGKARDGASSADGTMGGDGQGQTTSFSSSIFKSGQTDEKTSVADNVGEGCQMSTPTSANGTLGGEVGRAKQRSKLRNGSSDSSENKQLASPSGDLVSSSDGTPTVSNRPTELKGLKNKASDLCHRNSTAISPVIETRSPIDESKMIDKWQYYNSPISPVDVTKALLERSNSKDSNNNNNNSDSSKENDKNTTDAKENNPDSFKENVRLRKISNGRNPRRVTSRSSSRLFADMDLSEETGDESEIQDPVVVNSVGPDGISVIPNVITSAKDISREVIDTLRYSRDEAKKEYYTQKILEAVGLVSQSAPRSPSDESEGSRGSGINTNGQPGTRNTSRSRKCSSAASACIILKDFLQTIVPQEAAHNVLIGDIDYMVIDDEGVRYFESAMGFASRRNSRFDIRQAATARSRSGSQDHSADDSSGPWPWADVGPRSRRASIDEFRKRLLEQDATVTKTRSPSRERPNLPHGRHSVAAFPLSRTSSGFIPQMKSGSSRRGSLAEDYAMTAAASAAVLGRKRKVGTVDASNRLKRFSRPSFD